MKRALCVPSSPRKRVKLHHNYLNYFNNYRLNNRLHYLPIDILNHIRSFLSPPWVHCLTISMNLIQKKSSARYTEYSCEIVKHGIGITKYFLLNRLISRVDILKIICYYGNIELYEWFINRYNYDELSLYMYNYAILGKNIDMIKYLFNKNIHQDKIKRNKKILYKLAIYTNDLNVYKEVLSYLRDNTFMESEIQTIGLISSCFYFSFDIFKYLVDNNNKNCEGKFRSYFHTVLGNNLLGPQIDFVNIYDVIKKEINMNINERYKNIKKFIQFFLDHFKECGITNLQSIYGKIDCKLVTPSVYQSNVVNANVLKSLHELGVTITNQDFHDFLERAKKYSAFNIEEILEYIYKDTPDFFEWFMGDFDLSPIKKEILKIAIINKDLDMISRTNNNITNQNVSTNIISERDILNLINEIMYSSVDYIKYIKFIFDNIKIDLKDKFYLIISSYSQYFISKNTHNSETYKNKVNTLSEKFDTQLHQNVIYESRIMCDQRVQCYENIITLHRNLYPFTRLSSTLISSFLTHINMYIVIGMYRNTSYLNIIRYLSTCVQNDWRPYHNSFLLVSVGIFFNHYKGHPYVNDIYNLLVDNIKISEHIDWNFLYLSIILGNCPAIYIDPGSIDSEESAIISTIFSKSTMFLKDKKILKTSLVYSDKPLDKFKKYQYLEYKYPYIRLRYVYIMSK